MSEEKYEWPESLAWPNKATELFNEHMKQVVARKINDYTLTDSDGSQMTTNTIFQSEGDRDNERGVWTNKDLLTRFHPDKVDINSFWKIATDHFPQFSIAGGRLCKPGRLYSGCLF